MNIYICKRFRQRILHNHWYIYNTDLHLLFMYIKPRFRINIFIPFTAATGSYWLSSKILFESYGMGHGWAFNRGAFTNDVVILGGGGLGKMTRERWRRFFNTSSGKNLKRIELKKLVLLY